MKEGGEMITPRLCNDMNLRAMALVAVAVLVMGSIRVGGQEAGGDAYEALGKFKFGQPRVPLAHLISARRYAGNR